jgi:hypothetical protein
MMKPLAICFLAGLAMSLGSASARDLHGTTNSTIGSKDASTGTNGTVHSTANRALRGTGGSERSVNATANSTIGSGSGAVGTTGTAHSTTNRALNTAK